MDPLPTDRRSGCCRSTTRTTAWKALRALAAKPRVGWTLDDGQGTVAVALRDFWQQWPKSLEVDARVVRLGLFPRFEAGTFAHMGPWYKHDYLFDGNAYRLRQGQTRRWQVWIDLSGNGEALSKCANQSCTPIADPTQAIATGQWGYIAPAGSRGMADYDRWADNLFEGYCRSIREQRDYGAMNWGDWWGERGCNWGNHEYDTPLHMLIQFARTGDPRYFAVAEQAARHYSEVDVVHFVNQDLKKYFSQWESPDYPSRPGMVHEHSIGHVGGFHPVEKIRELYVELKIGNTDNPYLCLDPFNLGHIFTLGMAHYYLLSGDPWIKETIEKIGDNLMRLAEDGRYAFKGGNHVGTGQRLDHVGSGRSVQDQSQRALFEGHEAYRRRSLGRAGSPLRRLAVPTRLRTLRLRDPQTCGRSRLHHVRQAEWAELLLSLDRRPADP